MVQAIFDGSFEGVEFDRDPVFGVEVPRSCPGVPDLLLHPRDTWADRAAYDARAAKLAAMFIENFEKLGGEASPRAAAGAPIAGGR
jgi:phosphoenolpyruvate carboxykinase (ATP)